MSSLLERFEATAVDLGYARGRQSRMVGSFSNPDLHTDLGELMLLEAQGRGLTGRSWVEGSRAISGPTAGLGFAGAPIPNTEPVNTPTATTGVTAETNLYTPATTTNADWALIPQGSFRAPQAWLIFASGVYTSSSTSQTCIFTSRIGTSSTPASNATLGATGAVSLGAAAAITAGLWFYAAQMTIRTPGTSGTAYAVGSVKISNVAAATGPTTTAEALFGNTSATVDTTLQQGYVISVTPSATGVSVTLGNFVLIAVD